MSPSRKTEIKRFMRKLERPELRMVFLLQDVEDPVNVGSIFRIADACKVEGLILSGITARPPHKLISKVGRGKEARVPWRHVEDPVQALAELGAQGFTRYAVEITDSAVPYTLESYPDRICLVVGHEDHGVTKKVLAACDRALFIPMFGKGASLNVHVALAVVAFEALRAAAQPG